MRLYAALFTSVMLCSLAPVASAVLCEDVFSNAVGTIDGKLEIKDDAALLNTGDRVLATGDFDPKKGVTPCDGQACVESGTDAPTLTLPPNNTKTDLKDESLVLAPGDYYFDKFELKDNNTITLIGSGQVRIHVSDDLKISDNALVNVDGNPLDLIFLVGKKVEIKDAAQVKAVIYAEDDVKIKDDAQLEGAIVGKKAKVEDNATVTYSSTDGLVIDGVCGPVALSLDHVRISHDGSGIVGVPEYLTLTACANADCSELYTGSVTLDLLPADAGTLWGGSGPGGSQISFTGGTSSVSLRRDVAGTITLGAVASSAATNPTRCFVGATETCLLVFAAADFSVVVPDQVSAQTAVGSVSPTICWAEFQSQTRQVSVAVQTVSPAWSGPGVSLNGVALPTDGTTAMITLTFDAACVATLQLDYPEVGALVIDVTYSGTGPSSGLVVAGSGGAVFYPAALIAEVANAAGTPLGATGPGASPVHAAGAAFTLTVTAVNGAGMVTQGYRPQDAGRLLVYAERTGPIPGFEGTLRVSPTGSVVTQVGPPTGPADFTAGNIQPTDFAGGRYVYTAADYSEVGLIRLHLMDADYLGHVVSGAALQVGRFVPAWFEASGSVLNRSATPGCVGGSFSYLEEPFRVSAQLSAHNAAGGVTRNYQDAFAPFVGAGFSTYVGVAGNTVGMRSGATDLSSRLNLNGVSLALPWAAGLATLQLDMALARAGSVDGPFDGSAVGLVFADTDGVALQALDLDVDGNGSIDHVSLGTTDLRFGRLSLGNAHGSELRALSVPLAMQYFAGPGVGFVVHTLDNCTQVAGTLLSDADASDTLALADTCIVDELAASGTFACAPGTSGIQYRSTPIGGIYALSLDAPGAGRTGGIRVLADAPAWAQFDWLGSGDQDPVATATFGIFARESGIVYQRELR